MALSQRISFMVVALAAPVAMWACSSSSGTGGSTSTGGTTTTTTSSNTTSSNTTSSSSTSSSTTTASCSSTMDGGATACDECCVAAHPTGYATFQGLALASCGCASGSPCLNADASDTCTPTDCAAAADGGMPSTGCVACVTTQVEMGASSSCALAAATSSSCTGDCAAFVQCGLGC